MTLSQSVDKYDSEERIWISTDFTMVLFKQYKQMVVFAASLDNTWTGKLSSSIFLKRGFVDSTLRQGGYVLLHKTNIRPGERMNFAQNKEICTYLEGACWIYDIHKNHQKSNYLYFPFLLKKMYGKPPKDTEQMNSFKIITTYWTPVELYFAKNSFQCITNYLCIRFP